LACVPGYGLDRGLTRAGVSRVEQELMYVHDVCLSSAELTAATALRITSVTTCGCEIMITWEPSTSVIVAPARLAMARMTSLPAALSPVATTAQEGKVFQAGTPDGSENASSATGRWVAAMMAVCSAGRSAAKASWRCAGW